MVDHNVKRYVSAIIFTFLVILGLTSLANSVLLIVDLDLWGLISTSVTITSSLVAIFIGYLWRCRIFQGWLVPFPNLNGKWEGRIKYNYDGADLTRKVNVQIIQSFTNIVVKFDTKESKSNTFCCSFNIDKNRDIKQLIYSYYNEPDTTIRGRSPLHYGTTKLDISKDNKSLDGEYWTNRKTIGSIKLHRVK